MGKVVKDEYSTDYVAGQDNITPFGLDLHAPVFPITAILVVAFVIGTLMFPGKRRSFSMEQSGTLSRRLTGFS